MRRRLTTAAAVLVAAVGMGASASSAAAAPLVEDGWASDVSATAVDLHGSVNPGGLPTTARVEYLTAAAYAANLSAEPPRDGFAGASASPTGAGVALGSGLAPVAFTRHVGLLSASTAYRYRVVATNAAGTAYGPALSFTTSETEPVFSLPDGRGWEMVSPADKGGGELQGPGEIFGGGVFQAAASGAAVTYGSRSSFAGGAGSPGASQYLARRIAAGWSTANVTGPTLAGAYGDEPDGVPFQLFASDLERAVVVRAERCAEAPCPRRLELLDGAGATVAGTPARPDLRFAGANAGLTQIVLSSCAALLPGATEVAAGAGCDPAEPNLYAWTGGELALINLLPGETSGTVGAHLAAPGGAISADGSRIYFELGGNLYLREGGETVQIDTAAGGGGRFETASEDGAFAFLAKDGHLYRFDAADGGLADLTPEGEVEGVLGAWPDGSGVYFATPTGVFLQREGETVRIADGAETSNYPPASGAARVAANGTLAFLSSAPPAGFDNGGHAEAVVYSPATGTLTCASCNRTGARALGPASIPGARANGSGPAPARPYKPRALSAAGTRLFFESADKLAVADTNGARDVYQWEAPGSGSCLSPGGCVSLISNGRSPGGATFVDASADGSDAYFLTDASLVPADAGLVDLYDARVGGGFPSPPVPIACLGDTCQPVPAPPEDSVPATLLPSAEGNPPLRIQKPKHKAKKHKKKAKKRQKRKGQAKKKGARR